jgi:hypothetical protein
VESRQAVAELTDLLGLPHAAAMPSRDARASCAAVST